MTIDKKIDRNNVRLQVHLKQKKAIIEALCVFSLFAIFFRTWRQRSAIMQIGDLSGTTLIASLANARLLIIYIMHFRTLMSRYRPIAAAADII